ncbi:MAG: iron dicitrate transport regulator FecR [Isosphaeraceae bacterium]|nr:iron dicitrate transport regulator FecR [Isosphaeraceae bacterium]
MTNESPESDELLGLLSELVDGGLTSAQTDRLRELLRNDPGAQDLYLWFMRIHTQLHLDYDSGSRPTDVPGESSMPLKPLSTPLLELAVGGTLGPGFEETDAAPSPIRNWLSTAVVGWTVAVLLAIGLVVVRWSPGPRKSAVVARAPKKVDAADGVGVVVRAENLRWETDDGRIPKEGDILPKGRLQVSAGRAIISMFSGVTVIVEGPADVDLLSVDRIACNRGKLRARVPEGAEGFVISGPGTAVVDLGTEFGINVKADGKSYGKVFQGEVEAAVLGTAGTLRHSQVVRQGSEAFEIDPGSGLINPLRESEEFVAPFVPSASPLTLAPGYRDSVLASGPVCYWRFESMVEGKVPNEIPAGPPLLTTGPIQLVGSATGNRCAQFESGQNNQYFLMGGPWRPERYPGYAIELWFLAETIGHASLVSMITPRDTTDHLSLVELTSSSRLALFRPGSVRFLYRWPTSRGGGHNLFSDDYYVPFRWRHLVAQVAGDRMELYLDGLAQASQPINPPGSTKSCQVILGRLSTLTGSATIHHTGFRRGFVGLMDEVALYNRPLAPEEIRAHSQLAARPSRSE